MAQRLWEPSADQVADSLLTRFCERLRARELHFTSYADLHAWSVMDLETFWAELWEFAGVCAAERSRVVLEDGDRMPGARWFPEARLNFAENLLRHRGSRAAIEFFDETGARRELTHDELRGAVARASAGFRALGIGPGDRVAAVLPNVPETVVAMLAATCLGAVWSSCSPDFGSAAILDRFSQIEPKLLIGVDGYSYGGRRFERLQALAEIRAELPTVQHTLVVRYLDPHADVSRLPGAVAWDAWLDGGAATSSSSELVPVALPFDHPLYILYSSGTTGPPKCIVHGAGGTLLQHLKELLLHTDLRPGDRILYFTTCGWMMWNWLVSALAVGATVVLYEGSPFHPDAEALFRVAERARLTHFGVSARFLAASESRAVCARDRFDLAPLRVVLSTGSPLSPEGFRYVYANVKSDVRLSSISGGTDIVSCFLAGNPNAPVYAGELQCAGLGMAVAAFDPEGRARIGQKGELVCTRPFPSMPLGFVNDPDGSRYHRAYFERFPGVWHHGDFVELTERGTAIVYGRSDATLNPGGVRIGTAEIYRQVETLPDVIDSLVVGQERDGDVRVILFVELAPGRQLDSELRDLIRRRIRSNTSPRHVPAEILQVDAIPYTRSGKKVELAVRELIHGRPVLQTEAIANPECLPQFAERLADAART